VREPGRRAKVAVFSHDKNVKAVGTCIGHMGSRIQNIVRELGNERIDVIEWSEDPKTFILNALAPAKILKIEINKADNVARVIVPESQLSLAIGKEGQNVRLAVKLTGWKIDIISEEGQKVAEAKVVADAKAAVEAKEVDVKEEKNTSTEPSVKTEDAEKEG
jgi:transcription termination/antitermination protein NusA